MSVLSHDGDLIPARSPAEHIVGIAQRAAGADRTVTMLDGRMLDPSPGAFLAETRSVLADERAVLLIDAFEHIHGLESWLRERFLPHHRHGGDHRHGDQMHKRVI